MRITLNDIERAVCTHFKMTGDELRLRRRYRCYVRPRQIFMVLAREMTGASYPRIAAHIGTFDHTTILQGIRSIERNVKVKEKLAAHLAGCRELVKPVFIEEVRQYLSRPLVEVMEAA